MSDTENATKNPHNLKNSEGGKSRATKSKIAKPKGAGKLKGLQQGLSEAQLQRFYLRFLHGTGEKQGLQELLEQREVKGNQLLYVREQLDKKQQKKLKKLLKVVKGNKKSIKTIKLVGFLVIIAAFIVFNIFFKNKLVEWGIEVGISSLTGASVECDQAYLHWNGELGFAHLAVANPQDLRLNLIELGPTEFDISVWQLMLRKVVINEIRGENLRWNTRRETEGVRTKELAKSGDSNFDLGEELRMAGIDPQTLFEQGKSQFASLEAADKLQQKLGEAVKWPDKIEQHKNSINQISQEIKAIDLDNITVERVPGILQKGQALAPKVEKLATSLDQDLRQIDQQIRESSSAIDTISKNFENDLAKLKQQAASGNLLGSPISDFMKQYVRNKLSGIALMNSSVMTVIDRFQQQQRKRKAEGGNTNMLKDDAVKADVSRKGRNYFFPSNNYPSFLIKRIFFSLGSEDAQPYMRFEVKDIANDADVQGYPVEGQYLGIDGGVKTEARFLLENRSKVRQVVNCQPLFIDICQSLQNNFAEFELSEQPFQLPSDIFAKLQMPYIESYDAKMRTMLRLEQIEVGSKAMRGTLEASIYDQQLKKDSGLNLLQQTLVSVLENNGVELGTSFELSNAGQVGEFQLETNIEAILNREMLRLQQRALDAALVEAEKLLREQLGEDLGSVRSELDKLRKYKGNLMSQKGRVAQQKQFSSGLKSRVNKEVEKQKNQKKAAAIEELKKAAPKINVPKSVPKLF